MKYTVSYSQNREDIILDALLGRQNSGFYVDVGAAHPDQDSVTKYFYEKGWHGVNIDANSVMVDLLKKRRPKDINICIGVASKKGSLTLRQYPEAYGLSTFSKKQMKEHKKVSKAKNYIEEVVNTDRLSSILKKHGVKKDIDFLKIDVEGFEEEVLKGNDWKKNRPKIICIESNHKENDWSKILKENKYKNVFFDGLNEYYYDLHKGDFDRSKFIDNYLDLAVGQNIVNTDIDNILSNYRNRLDIMSTKLRESNQRVKFLQQRPGVIIAFNSLIAEIENFLKKKYIGAQTHKRMNDNTKYFTNGNASVKNRVVTIKKIDYTKRQLPRENVLWIGLEKVSLLVYLSFHVVVKIINRIQTLIRGNK